MTVGRGPRAVDRARVDQRLERIEVRCDALDAAAGMNAEEFLAAHISAASAWPVAEGYAATFRVLEQRGVLDEPLAERLALAAGLRNLLVHDYLEIDPARLHASLSADVEDLRALVRTVVRWLAGPPPSAADAVGEG